MQQALSTLIIFILAAGGGVLFYFLQIPLAWMLGPLSFVVIWGQLRKQQQTFPLSVRNAALVVLGYLIGKAFTVEAAAQIVAQLPVMLLVTVLILLMSLLLGYITHRKTGISFTTGMLGSVPGGFSQMVLMSEEIEGADVSVVSFMHTIRLLSVVFIVPYLATQAVGGFSASGVNIDATANALISWTPIPGRAFPVLIFSLIAALLANKVNLPTPFLMGPILAGAALSLAGVSCPSLPVWLTILCQISVGAYMGVKIELASLSNWRILTTYTLLGVAAVIAASLGIAFMLSSHYGYSNVTTFLSMAPGGIAEMSVTGIALGADLSVIASYQIFRLFFILLLTPLLFRRWLK
jgi:membrane AbrB-like protein